MNATTMPRNDSFIVIVTDPHTGKTQYEVQWEVEGAETDVDLYRLAQQSAARMICGIGHGEMVIHIELTTA